MTVYVDSHPDSLDLARALALLPPDRLERTLRLRGERDRRLAASVYLLLRAGLRRAFGLAEPPPIALSPAGKPFFPDRPDIHFNFSHCRRAAVCALGTTPVGVDAEAIASVDEAVARHVLSDEELRTLHAASDPEASFARLWTMKEALFKLRGEPLDEARLPDILSTRGDIRLETRRMDGFALSCAWQGASDDLEIVALDGASAGLL